MMGTQGAKLLDVQDLDVRIDSPEGAVRAVNHLNFQLHVGETLGIVGESGSGKSQAVLACLGLAPKNARIGGSAKFHGEELIGCHAAELNRIRGARIAMIFQDPMTSLNPHLTVALQMIEMFTYHQGMSRRAARQRAIQMLDAVKIPGAGERINSYPHEFSGGMRQRVMIAMALACNPELLIADEPTTALDVTVQAQILALLYELRREFQMAMILITHDLGVVAGSCDQVLVMYAGEAMEHGTLEDIFYRPQHPYTEAMLRAMPRLDAPVVAELATIPGAPPDLLKSAQGCPFYPRCSYRLDTCHTVHPKLRAVGPRHVKACHLERITDK